MGTVAVLAKKDMVVKRVRIEDAEVEIKRVGDAIELAKAQL